MTLVTLRLSFTDSQARRPAVNPNSFHMRVKKLLVCRPEVNKFVYYTENRDDVEPLQQVVVNTAHSWTTMPENYQTRCAEVQSDCKSAVSNDTCTTDAGASYPGSRIHEVS